MAARKTYQTKIRTEILTYFQKNSSITVSVSELKAYLNTVGIEANNTTIYRYLDKLCSENVVLKYPDADGEKAVYQYAGEAHRCTEHLHLKCVKCGRVIHLDCSFMDEFKEHLLKEHRFHIQCAGDLLHGLCGDCWDKKNKLQQSGEMKE